MTLLKLLNLFAGAGTKLADFLLEVKTQAPDLAIIADEWLSTLNASLSAESLVELGTAVMGQLGNIAKLQFDGRRHPSDA